MLTPFREGIGKVFLVDHCSLNQGAMSQKPVPMDKVQQIQRLHREGVPIKEIARRLGISRNSVKKYIRRLKDGPDTEELLPLSKAAYGSEQTDQSMRRYEDLLRFFAEASSEPGRTGLTREVLP